MITRHTHLAAGNERQILPWLKFSAELDPQRIDTYTVAAYWLRKQLGKTQEAEDFLREGLLNNPNSWEILFELGRLFEEEKNDTTRARNLWLQAFKKWRESEPQKKEPDTLGLNEILARLANLEEKQGNLSLSVQYWQLALKVSPSPAEIEARIQSIHQQMMNPNADKEKKESAPVEDFLKLK
jgi:tetratricopeptide (TPR) repeat protein